jgi:hypothetical protein
MEAVIGLAGVVAGLVFGGTGKYFNQRRDAWLRARAAGLLLLADVRALRDAEEADLVVAETQLGAKSWASHRQTLAGFRRGTYPNGLTAPDWLKLAGHFARLKKINDARNEINDARNARRSDLWCEAQHELAEVEGLLRGFELDPPVLPYVVRHSWRKVGVKVSRG